MANQKKSGRYVLPALLIALGLVMLALNSGLVSWAALLGVLQLWPLVLIAVGVDLLFRGRYRLVITAVTLALGMVFYLGLVPWPGMAPAETHTIAQTLQGAQRAEVLLQSGVSELRIGALTSSDQLIEGTVQTGAGEQLAENFRLTGSAASYTLRSEQRGTQFFASQRERLWDVRLSDALPLTLEVSTGVGRARLELTALQLTDLRVDTGVGETLVTLPRQGQYDVTINAGVGATTLRIPEGVAARLEISRGLGAVNMRGTFEQDGNVYKTPDYDTATNRAEVRVSGGVGAITVEAGFLGGEPHPQRDLQSR